MKGEEWRPIPGWEGYYEASSLGRIRTVGVGPGRREGRILKPNASVRYYRVFLSRDGKPQGKYVHRLVCETFNGPPENSEMSNVLHWDDNPLNNRADNLRWGTLSDNMHDRVRNGRYRNQNTDKTHCIRGHLLPDDRKCRECIRLAKLARAEIGLPEADSRHGTLTGYTFWLCRCDNCKGAMREYDANKYRSRQK